MRIAMLMIISLLVYGCAVPNGSSHPTREYVTVEIENFSWHDARIRQGLNATQGKIFRVTAGATSRERIPVNNDGWYQFNVSLFATNESIGFQKVTVNPTSSKIVIKIHNQLVHSSIAVYPK